jgi:hypothetical protein
LLVEQSGESLRVEIHAERGLSEVIAPNRKPVKSFGESFRKDDIWTGSRT